MSAAPLPGEELVPGSCITYTWNDEGHATYCELLTYKDSATSLGTRVTIENTSTLSIHQGFASATDKQGRTIVTIQITAPFPLTSYDISKQRIKMGDGETATSDRYGVNLSMN